MEWLTNPASIHGMQMRIDWYIFIAAGIFVGLYVYGCIVWCLIRYRRRANRAPQQFEPILISPWLTPAIVVDFPQALCCEH